MRRMNVQLRTILVLVSVFFLASDTTPTAVLAQSKRSPVAPNRERVEAVVTEAYNKFRTDTSGKNADYIPFLAQVDSKLFGVSVVTTDNQTFNLGDVSYSFSIQSISKVFTLAMAMGTVAQTQKECLYRMNPPDRQNLGITSQ